MNVRYAVYDTINNETLAANYIEPGAAANHAELDYFQPRGLVVVKTINDKIIGECTRKGVMFKVQRHKFNPTVWSDFCRQ